MQYAPINIEFINPFVESTAAVFQTMLGVTVKRGALYLKESFQPSQEVTGIIGLSGIARGSVLLGLSRPIAIKATSMLLGEPCESLDHHVIDAVGELTNMITGAAKAKLERLQMSIGLPTVIVGRNHTVVFPTGVAPIGIPFETDIGPICLEVSLAESTEADPVNKSAAIVTT